MEAKLSMTDRCRFRRSAKLGTLGMEDGRPVLPTRADVLGLLSVSRAAALDGVLDGVLHDVLFEPIEAFAARRGKRFRSRLVTLGFRLAGGDPDGAPHRRRCWLAGEAVELIHAGSLIVDDIEDGSLFRRGAPALHRLYGLPIALNIGNWLYFWPAEIFKRLRLTPGEELLVGQYYYRTLLKAHYGQALDLGVAVDNLQQACTADVCLAAMELKTGALIALAVCVGAILAGASRDQLAPTEEFGLRFGMALQMFDDIVNASSRRDPAKQYEDLVLRRPSWLWACAARGSSPQQFSDFVACVKRLPDTAALNAWLERHRLIESAKLQAREFLANACGILEESAADLRFSSDALQQLRDLGQKVALAYD